MAELAPPDPAGLDAEVRALLDLTAVRNEGKRLAIIAALAHRPELVAPFLRWSAALADAGALGARRHELVALRTSWHHRSDYEWGNHARLAAAAGCTDAEIAAVGAPDGDTSSFDAADRALLRLVDTMCATRVDPGEARDAALELLGAAAVVEAVWTVGQYAGLSLVAGALGLALEPGTPPVPPKP